MTTLPKEQLAKRLQSLNNSQQSIEGTAGWCLFYRKDAKSVVQVWDAEFSKSTADRKLALFFLANHILQESKKKGREFIDEFYKVLPRALKAMTKGGDEKIKRSIGRVLSIWEERRVYGSNQLRTFKELMSNTPTSHSHEANNHTLSGPDKKKLQLVGSLAEVMLQLQQAEDHSSDWASKSLSSLRQGLTDDGTLSELNTAIRLLRSYQAALKSELVARDAVLAQLTALISKQEDAKTRSDDQLRLCGVQQEKLEERIAMLERGPPAPTQFMQQSTPQYMQAPSPVYQQQSTPLYAPQQPSPQPNPYAAVPVTQLTPSVPNTLLASLPSAINSLAGVLNGSGLNIPVAIPSYHPTSTVDVPPVHPPPSSSPQAPRLEEYSPSAGADKDPMNVLDGGLAVEGVDPAAYLAAALGSSDVLAKNLADALASMPAEDREHLQREFSAFAQQPVGGDDDDEYNPEYGD